MWQAQARRRAIPLAVVIAAAVATGDGFDKMWLTMMIAHHEGAVEMAKSVKGTGSDVDAKQLADRIISAQRDEITEMNGLLAG